MTADADDYPGGLALAAMAGASKYYQDAYRVGYRIVTDWPGDVCGGNAVGHIRDLEDAGVVPSTRVSSLRAHTGGGDDIWDDFYSKRPPFWEDVESGFRDGWAAGRADIGGTGIR